MGNTELNTHKRFDVKHGIIIIIIIIIIMMMVYSQHIYRVALHL